ncbi:MAG: hypothetical protein AAF649_09245 [Verrucomicrobiota bacterium]
MITLHSTRTIHAPRWLCFEMIRNVDVHAAAVPDIRARAEGGRQHGALQLGEHTEWSARYFGIRFRITMEVTDFDWPIRYEEINRPGLFRVFRHRYSLMSVNETQTVLRDQMEFETGWGWLGRLVDRLILAHRLRHALEIRMDHLKAWSEDDTWQYWISEADVKYLKGKTSA